MLWRLGVILESVKYRAEKDIRETLLRNQNFKNNKWTPLERLVAWGAKNTMKAVSVILTTFILTTIILTKNYEVLKSLAPAPLSSVNPIIEIQSSLFGAQATLVGLIFPLVIAFIGILLQGKAASKAMWVVYKNSSGFMLVGFSSIALLLTMTVIKIISPWVSPEAIIISSAMLALWFSFNLTLSSWFLWKTVKFLSNADRMLIILKYSINEVLRSDIVKRLEGHHGEVALKNEFTHETESALQVKPFAIDELPHGIIKKSKSNESVYNIWLRPLKLGVFSLKLQVGMLSKTEKEETLCFVVKVGGKGSPHIKVADTSLPYINPFSRSIIKSSIRLSKENASDSLGISDIVSALFGQLEDSLSENNSKLFKQSRDELIKFQKEIESSCQFIDDNGDQDNWLLLKEARVFGRDFIVTFIWEGTKITSLVISRIQEDSSYFESWCYFYLGLFSFEDTGRPIKIGKEYITGHYLVWKELMSWLGGNEVNDSLQGQLEDRAIKCFVGSWEQWSSRIDKEDATISDNEYWYKMHHLEKTSLMVAHSIKNKNAEAAQWAVDMLINWSNKFSSIRKHFYLYGWHGDILTPDLLVGLTDDIRGKVTEGCDFDECEAAIISLINYWLDIRCILASYIIVSGSYEQNEHIRECLRAIIGCSRLKPSGDREDSTHAIKNPQDLMGIYLRQYGTWATQNDYKERLEEYTNALSGIQEPAWVSGRIYSWIGTTRERYLPRFFAIYGIGLSEKEFSLTKKWKDFLSTCSVIEIENLIRELNSLKTDSEDVITHTSNIFEVDTEEVAKRKELFEVSIDKIVDYLNGSIEDAILESEVDEKILKDYGVYASEDVFSKHTGPSPLNMFREILFDKRLEINLSTLKFIDFSKSNVGKGLEVNRAINEKEWLNSLMRQRVQIDIFHQLMKLTNWDTYEPSSVEGGLGKIVEDGKKIIVSGKTPILFVGPWRVYKKVDASKWDYTPQTERLPYEIRVESGMGDSYICHMDEIEVHRLPFSKSASCLLISKEKMTAVKVAEFEEGRFVNVTFEEDKDNKTIGTLSLSYGINCYFSDEKGYRYIFHGE